MNLVNNPIFKLVGIGVIIYFALFHDTSKKENLRNRLSSEKIKKNLIHARDKATYIKESYDKSKEYDRGLKQKDSLGSEDQKDASPKSVCEGHMFVNYIKLGAGDVVEKKGHKLELGKSDLSKKLIGMKAGEKRRVFINEKIDKNNVQFVYDVEILEIVSKKNNKECNN
jgi:hypothetical protein